MAIALAATVPFLSTLNTYFIADDFGVLHLFSKKPPFHVLSLFTQPWTENLYGAWTDEIRPTLALLFQAGWWVGSGSPIPFHAALIALHLASSLTVFGLARTAARLNVASAAGAGLLFALLPVQAEAASWLQGAADSVPTLFMLLTLLGYARWRRDGSRWAYAAAVLAYGLALWSKQSAITVPLLLAAMEVLLERRPIWRDARFWLAWAPFAILTALYLGLRLALFGNAVRENQLGVQTVLFLLLSQGTQVFMLVTGLFPPLDQGLWPAAALGLLAAGGVLLVQEVRRVARSEPLDWRAYVAFFGPAWWIAAVGPLAVTYVTPRHLYFEAAGFAILVASVLASAVRVRATWRRPIATAAGAVLLACIVALLPRVEEWNAAGRLSRTILTDLEREALAAPSGSLLVVGAPGGRREVMPTWVWAWALPYAAQPPFTRTDLTRRVTLVEPLDPYCCWDGDYWERQVREGVAAWIASGNQEVVVLVWDPGSGQVSRATSREDPLLLELARALQDRQKRELRDGMAALLGRAQNL